MNFDLKQLTLDNLISFVEKHGLSLVTALAIYYIAKYGKVYIDKSINKFLEKAKIERSIAGFVKSIYSLFYYVALFYIIIEKEGIWMFTKKVFISSLSIMFALSGISVVQAQNTGEQKTNL